MPKDTDITEEFTIDAQKLRAELDRIHGKKQSSGESSSALAQQRKMAAEGLGCQKDALSLIERIDGFSDDKLADFMRSFEPMFEAMLPQWQDRILDMVDKAEAEAEQMDAELQ